METRPWRTGWVVCAAAAAMAAEPMPDSLEKMPRATPYWIAMIRAEPVNPPTAAVPVNASVKMRASAAGIAPTLAMRMYSAPSTYSTIMTGTRPAVTRPIERMPPTSTMRVATVRMRPVIHGSSCIVRSTFSAIELPCVMLPMPKEARNANTAKLRARTFPSDPLIPFCR